MSLETGHDHVSRRAHANRKFWYIDRVREKNLSAISFSYQEELMKLSRHILVLLLTTSLIWPLSANSSATTCVAVPPLKPIHRICGVVFFPSGDRTANAKVTVLQAGKEIAVQQTTNDGKFSFDHLEAGDYEIRIQVNAIPLAATKVVLVHPEVKPKREIAVSMMTQGCSSFSLVDPEKFENGLNPSSSSQD